MNEGEGMGRETKVGRRIKEKRGEIMGREKRRQQDSTKVRFYREREKWESALKRE